MDNLIAHLENTLNDDECVKEALLLLKNLEGIPKKLLSNQEQSQSPTSKRDFEQLCNSHCKTEHTENVLINPQLVAIFGLISFLRNDFQTPNELPIRIVAFRLGVSFDNLREICYGKKDFEWPTNFFDLCLKIIECFEMNHLLMMNNNQTNPPDNSLANNKTIEMTKHFKEEIEDLKTHIHQGSVTDFIQKNIGQYLEQRAVPMPLGDINYGHHLVTQEVLLVNDLFLGRSTIPVVLPSIMTALTSSSPLRGESTSGVTTRNPTTPLPTWNSHSGSGTSPRRGHTFSSNSPSLLAFSPGGGGDKTMTTGSCGGEVLSPQPLLYQSLFKLAPLVEFPRCPKHFIVPLMEPDLMSDFQGALPPSLNSLGLGMRQEAIPAESRMMAEGDSQSLF